MACMQANKSEKVIASTETTMQQQPVLSWRYLEESGENGCRMEEGAWTINITFCVKGTSVLKMNLMTTIKRKLFLCCL
jgi:hypothetical protein